MQTQESLNCDNKETFHGDGPVVIYPRWGFDPTGAVDLALGNHDQSYYTGSISVGQGYTAYVYQGSRFTGEFHAYKEGTYDGGKGEVKYGSCGSISVQRAS